MIKHIPSGLFPHFDSGIERRPYFVKAGDTVTIGCRLDSSETAEVYMEISGQAGKQKLRGVHHSTNDRGQRYVRFVHQIENETEFRYRFVTSDGESSQLYECPVLQEITLLPRIRHDDNRTTLTY